jgi:hypothetical protein
MLWQIEINFNKPNYDLWLKKTTDTFNQIIFSRLIKKIKPVLPKITFNKRLKLKILINTVSHILKNPVKYYLYILKYSSLFKKDMFNSLLIHYLNKSK